MTIKLVKEISEDIPIDSKAKITYIDDFDQVFIDWTDGGQATFTEEQLLKNFEIASIIMIVLFYSLPMTLLTIKQI